MNCLRCGSEMAFLGSKKLQLGEYGVFFKALPNLIAGAFEVQIYQCKECGKLEFFRPVTEDLQELSPEDEAPIPQIACPACGYEHDFDEPRCPKCGHSYYEDIK